MAIQPQLNFFPTLSMQMTAFLFFAAKLPNVSRKYSLLINVDKTKVMASDGIACRILIQNEQLEQVDTFPYLGSLITEDGECTTEFRTRLNGSGNRGITAEHAEKSQHTDFNEDTTNESASMACSNIRLWKLDTQKEWRKTLDPFEMKGLK